MVTRNLLVNLLENQRHQVGVGTGSTDVMRLLDEVPERDMEASVIVDAEFRRRLFHHAADRVRGNFARQPGRPFGRRALSPQRSPTSANAWG